jgi:hypothetical protein
MAKPLAFWGIKYTYCKIIAVVKSTMLKRSCSEFGNFVITFISQISTRCIQNIFVWCLNGEFVKFKYLNSR